MSIQKGNSPYCSITGCSLLYVEFLRMLPLMMADNPEERLRKEVKENNLFQVNSLTSRQRFMAEFRRRYQAMPVSFWQNFLTWNEKAQRAGLFYVALKTYKLVFELHFNVTLKHWNSVDQEIRNNDLMMEISEISTRDAFVDSWSEVTKKRCAAQYLTMLRQCGLLMEQTHKLQSLHLELTDFEYYLRAGEDWFLEACLLYPYEINDIKQNIL